MGLYISFSFGTSTVPFLIELDKNFVDAWMFLVPTNTEFTMYFENAEHITNISYTARAFGFQVIYFLYHVKSF